MFVRHAKEMSQGPNFQFFVSALTRRQLKVGLLGEKLLLTSRLMATGDYAFRRNFASYFC